MRWQPNKLEQERLDKANRLKEQDVELYPRRAERSHTCAEAITLLNNRTKNHRI